MLWICCGRRSVGNAKSTDIKSDSKSTSSFTSMDHNETVELEDSDQFSDEEIKSAVTVDHKFYNDPPLRRPSTFTVETGTQTFDESSNKTFAKDEILSKREKAKSGKR